MQDTKAPCTLETRRQDEDKIQMDWLSCCTWAININGLHEYDCRGRVRTQASGRKMEWMSQGLRVPLKFKRPVKDLCKFITCNHNVLSAIVAHKPLTAMWLQPHFFTHIYWLQVDHKGEVTIIYRGRRYKSVHITKERRLIL